MFSLFWNALSRENAFNSSIQDAPDTKYHSQSMDVLYKQSCIHKIVYIYATQ